LQHGTLTSEILILYLCQTQLVAKLNDMLKGLDSFAGNELLDKVISQREIMQACKNLKNGRSLYNNAEWMTESNAFLRSTKQAYIFPDFCMYLQINVFNLKI
jgi:hypothetical protein